MGKYIKKFDTNSEYNTYINGQDAILPNVSYCVNENEMHYTQLPHDYSKDYFTIVSRIDNNEICWTHRSEYSGNNLSYSLDGTTWTNLTTPGQYESVTITTLNAGEKVMLKGINNCFCDQDYYYDTIGSEIYYDEINDISLGTFDVEGNIMSLIYGDNFLTNNEFPQDPRQYIFGYIFKNQGIHSAENLILPATILSEGCYYGMFSESTIEIPPKLLAMTLAENCYGGMFQYCLSLVEAPELPALTLASGCYSNMFYQCSNLNYIKAMFTSASQWQLWYWVDGVNETGTFVKNSESNFSEIGINGIPSGWTVQTASE